MRGKQNKFIWIIPNIESEHEYKFLAFEHKYIAFLQTCKRLKWFTFRFELKDFSYCWGMFPYFVRTAESGKCKCTSNEWKKSLFPVFQRKLFLPEVNQRKCNQKCTHNITQPAVTCSKLTIETLEQGVKYFQS